MTRVISQGRPSREHIGERIVQAPIRTAEMAFEPRAQLHRQNAFVLLETLEDVIVHDLADFVE